jgi:hypothetical protein
LNKQNIFFRKKIKTENRKAKQVRSSLWGYYQWEGGEDIRNSVGG